MTSIPGKPIQLIEQVNGNLVLNEIAAEKIRCLDGLLGVVTIVGPYLTGKSFIMNRLLNRSDGFKLGDLIESCTKGVWMWDNIMAHTNKAGHPINLIILDTQGLESPDSTPEWDRKIFILTLLMSSLFLYNTKNLINKEAIAKLGLMTRLADYIKMNKSMSEEENKKSLKTECADFMWLVRDFPLQIKISDPEYLTKALELEDIENNENKKTNERNHIRQSIESSFRSLDCATLPLPILMEGNIPMSVRLQKLGTLRYNRLRPEFTSKTDKLCEKIRHKVAVKSIHGKLINGPIFIEFVKDILRKLNNNEQIYVSETLSRVIRVVADAALEKAKRNFVESFENFIEKEGLAVPWKEYEQAEQSFIDSSYKILIDMITGSDEILIEYLKKFQEFICGDFKHSKKENNGKLYEYRTKNSKVIYICHKSLLQNLWNEKFQPISTRDSVMKIKDFEKRISAIETIYLAKSLDGPEKPKAYSDFLKELDMESLKQSVENWNIHYDRIIGDKIKAGNEKAELDSEKSEIEVKQKNLEIKEKHLRTARNEDRKRQEMYLELLNSQAAGLRKKTGKEKINSNNNDYESVEFKKKSVDKTNAKLVSTEINGNHENNYLLQTQRSNSSFKIRRTQSVRDNSINGKNYFTEKEKTYTTIEAPTTHKEADTSSIGNNNFIQKEKTNPKIDIRRTQSIRDTNNNGKSHFMEKDKTSFETTIGTTATRKEIDSKDNSSNESTSTITLKDENIQPETTTVELKPFKTRKENEDIINTLNKGYNTSYTTQPESTRNPSYNYNYQDDAYTYNNYTEKNNRNQTQTTKSEKSSICTII